MLVSGTRPLDVPLLLEQHAKLVRRPGPLLGMTRVDRLLVRRTRPVRIALDLSMTQPSGLVRGREPCPAFVWRRSQR